MLTLPRKIGGNNLEEQTKEKMEILTESNKWFDCRTYPEKEQDLNNMQGITVKGSRDEYLKMVQMWKEELKKKE